MIAGARFVPETRDPAARRPNVPGAILLAASLVAIVYPLLEGRQLGWPTWVWLVMAAGLAGLVVLGLLEARKPGRCKIAFLALPRIANFDDLDPLKREADVDLVMVRPGEAIPGDAKLVLLPGAKSTRDETIRQLMTLAAMLP